MIQNEIQVKQTVYFQKETNNKSFIDMHYYLKERGLENNAFFLVLFDTDLAGIDPRDPILTNVMKTKILRETMQNYWYFLREIVRIPIEGGEVGGGVRYKLHRGNLAMNFLFILNFNQFVELPRQHGKTVSALCRYLWVFNFGATNSKIMFIHKNHGGSKDNLITLKNLRNALPTYLQMTSPIGIDGKKIKVPNTVETMQHMSNGNKIVTLPSAKNKATANNLGRGCTMALQYYDEFAFIIHNRIIYQAATPAFKTASDNARNNGSPYGILITTTPGDLLTEEGDYAFNIRNSATPWSEDYYDMTMNELLDLKNSNQNSSFFHVKFSYLQLGSGEEYFRSMVVELLRDWNNIRREVLLEWARTSGNCPFKKEDLDIISQYLREPIRTMYFGRAKQYQFLVYFDIDMTYPPIIGVDVAGSSYQDSSAITVVDSKTTKVSAILNCNYLPSDDLAEILFVLVTKYMNNAIINIERNGGFGSSVLQRLIKTSIKKNLYYEIKDKVLEERSNGINTIRQTAKVKVYGLDSTKVVRSRLIEILYDRVEYHKDKFISPLIYKEMEGMEVKKTGKVEHSSTTHDDQVFSYLMAMYVWYDGINLMERFNIRKNSIKTDQDLDEILGEYNLYDNMELLDLETEEESNPILKDQLEVIDDANRIRIVKDFAEIQDEDDARALKEILSTKDGKASYLKKYSLEDAPTLGGWNDSGVGCVTIPNSVFDDFNSGGEDRYSIYQGNLGNIFENM